MSVTSDIKSFSFNEKENIINQLYLITSKGL